MGILPSPIQRDRIYLIEAALLRDRGRLNEALEKVKQSFGGLTDSGVKVALFLEEARLCRWLGRHRKAMEAFALADRDVPKVSDPRLRLRLEIERGLTLCDLGQHGEAGNLPADLRKTAAGLPIEQARLLCLQGRIAAGLGQPETAAQHLQTALAGLPDRALVDAALLALELAALYAHLGRMDELKVLTAETLKPLAEAPALSRGAAASLRLFCRLADQDKMSAERAAQFARDFPRGLV
jgi:tetratricopeptide (TPR) repeat protein